MKEIYNLIDLAMEELEFAQDYAEIYLKNLVDDNQENIETFKQMSKENLAHSKFLIDQAEQQKNVYGELISIPIETQEILFKEKQKYLKKSTWITKLLSM